jgi:hypothetical protein
MKPSAAYIVPQDSILNPTRNKLFDNFSADDSILLRTTLYLNLIENFLK